MCQVLQVSRRGYYRFLKTKPGPRAIRSAQIRQAVAAVFDSSNRVYGSVKVARILREDPALKTTYRNTVTKAMQKRGLKSCVSSKFKPLTTQTDHL